MSRPHWLDPTEYPFQSNWLELPMGRMHYLDEGEGPAIVMVHGTPDWSFSYRRLIAGLSDRFRCIAPDHIGFGLSDKPADWSYRPADHARNLTTLIEHLGLTDVTLVVHDFGGPIGLNYAIEHPENVDRLVLFNTWLWSLRGDAHFERADRIFGGALGRLLYKRFNFSARFIMKQAMGDKSRLTPAIHRHYLAPLATPADRTGTWVFARELIGSADWYDQLWSRIDRLRGKPALILWGMRDIAFRPVELERWERTLPQAEVVRFERAGHFPLEEQPQEILDHVVRFLEASQPATPLGTP